MNDHRFGVSSRLFLHDRLSREHLVHVAAHGFEAFELFAAPDHFDHRDAVAVTDLAEWLGDTRLSLHAVHAPDTASTDDLAALLEVARQVPFAYLNVHPNGASIKSLEMIAGLAAAAGVHVALEAQNDGKADAAALVRLLEDELDDTDIGICLDFGHAHLRGDLDEAIETVSGHLFTTHVHDNNGRRDDHLVPYRGTIHWESAIMEIQKIGYDGILMFAPDGGGDPVEVLKRCAAARQRLEQAFITF
jgi:sugar phosphate isomerase/epimerase